MFQTIRRAWAIPELRKKIVFTALMLLIFRIGNAIPVPYVDTALLNTYLDSLSTTILGLYNVMSGGAFANATLFALGVQPYINSSIIIQLLTIAIPALERLARDGGEEGRKKIQSITRYATVAIAILQGWGYYALMKNYGILTNTGIWAALVIIVSFMAGSAFVMWMGEQITEFGIGNGISMILFAGIISRVPNMVGSAISYVRTTPANWWHVLLVVGDAAGNACSFEFADDGEEACLTGARDKVRALVRSKGDASCGVGAPRYYALCYEGAVADGKGSYADALLMEFGEKGCPAFSAYSLFEGRGTGDNFRWTDPAPAGEVESLL